VCDRDIIELAHSPSHYENLLRTHFLDSDQLEEMTVEHDLYFCRDTFLAASLACGTVVNCVDAVLDNRDFGVEPDRA
jgi:acetoin utilization deacetylase AcuC-like enzyme